MIQLNLLPDIKKEYLKSQASRRKTIALSILITMIAVGISVAFAVYVYAVQNVIINVQTGDIKSKAQQLTSVKDIDKYLVVQSQLSALSELHGQKNNFSRLLDFLPRFNPAPPQNITISTLDVNAAEKTITFKGEVKDYGALTTFKDTLVNAEFSYQHEGTQQAAAKLFPNVKIVSAIYQKTENSAGVSFTVVATYEDAVFKQENVGVNVTVPNKETTQSVVDSPQALFGGETNAN